MGGVSRLQRNLDVCRNYRPRTVGALDYRRMKWEPVDWQIHLSSWTRALSRALVRRLKQLDAAR